MIVLSISSDIVLAIAIAFLSVLFIYVMINPRFGANEEIREEKVMPVTIGMGAG